VSPIKGYPLRVDFASAPTFGDRILLVGEAAGLVSPLTGEGIDFALESGQLAAGWIANALKSPHFDLGSYDALLRTHFQHLFVFLARLRQVYINPFLMNRTVAATEKFPELKELLVKIMMGEEDAARLLNLTSIRKIVLGV
jgi:flavin-dependent dehydrogenase